MLELKWNIIFGIMIGFTSVVHQTFGSCKIGVLSLDCLDGRNEERSCLFVENFTTLHHKLIDDFTADYFIKFLSLKHACGFNRIDVYIEYLSYAAFPEECVYKRDAQEEIKSVQHISFHHERNDNCSKLQHGFCVKYLFRGCYLFKIFPYTDSNSHRSVNHYVWIENNHTFKEFSIKRPVFKTIALNPVEVAWNFKPRTFVDEETSYKVTLQYNNGNSSVVTNSCSLFDQTINCQLHNITDWKCTLHFDLEDQWRCYYNDFFGVCSWSSLFANDRGSGELSELKFEKHLGGQLKYLDWILVGVLIVIFACVLAFILWYRKHKSGITQNFFTDMYPKFEARKNVKGILLLYARDCPAFMDTMVELRKYLISRTKSKVYDIFDTSLFDKIATSPYEFIESLLQDPQINVIVISTECFEQLYQSMLYYFSNQSNRGSEVLHLNQLYKSPQWLDGVVLHALKLISYDTSAASYKKFYVVRLPKFNGLGNYLININPCTRFDLPGGLDTLIEKVSSTLPDNGLMSSIENRESLHRALYNLNSFVLNKPDYLYVDVLKNKVINV